MADHDRYSLAGARAAAERDELGEWVVDFLASPGSDNGALAAALADRLRWWLGPVLVPLEQLNRLAGPPGDPVMCPVDEDYWRDDVDNLEQKVRDGWDPPPVIASYRNGELFLEDGNHRVEGVRRSGARETWTVIGFDSLDDRERFEVPSPPVSASHGRVRQAGRRGAGGHLRARRGRQVRPGP